MVGGLAAAAGAAEGAVSGASRVYEAPCKTGMLQMMARACEIAQVSAHDVDYIGEQLVRLSVPCTYTSS